MNLLYLHLLPLFCSFSLSLISRPSLSAVAQFNLSFLSNSPFSPPFPFTVTVSSRGHDLPCQSVGPSVSFLNCGRGFCINYPCPTVRDCFAVNPALFFFPSSLCPTIPLNHISSFLFSLHVIFALHPAV